MPQSHFTANPDYRYFGEDRLHRYDAPDNPIISRMRSKPLLLSSDNTETERYKERIIRHRRELLESQRLERMMLRQQRAELYEKLQKTTQGLTNYGYKFSQHQKKRVAH